MTAPPSVTANCIPILCAADTCARVDIRGFGASEGFHWPRIPEQEQLDGLQIISGWRISRGRRTETLA
jgi:hypothetical protein